MIDFYRNHVTDGYRRCAYMMMDQDIAYLSPSTIYHILKSYDVMRKLNRKPSKKGNGFIHAQKPHEQWHTDISHITVKGIFYHFISILDGYSRYIVHWELRETMTMQDVCIVQQRALEKFPGETPRMISDNGKQFVGKDYQELLSIHGLKHSRTSPYYPQSNGKLERFHQTIKGSEGIGNKHLSNIDHAKEVINIFVGKYNNERLHSAVGYVTPNDMLQARQSEIHQQRDEKLAQARLKRRYLNSWISA